MEKLNELVEQAKFVADWHGSDWSSALCQDKDGKQAHEIICESRGESVISTGSNSNEASWLCDYLELCSPANILAIAEAFRALEQREAEEKHRADQNEDYLGALTERMLKAEQRAEAAEGNLAELEKQEPVGYVSHSSLRMSAEGHMGYISNHQVAGLEGCYVYARPAPAINLTELVPREVPKDVYRVIYQQCGGFVDSEANAQTIWTCCRAAMLKKIEEAK